MAFSDDLQRLIGIFEYHEGCNGRPYCMGPQDDFYTLFGTELRFLGDYMDLSINIAIVLGLLLFSVLFFFKKRQKISMPFYFILILVFSTVVSAAVGIILFFALAYYFPVMVVY